MNRRQKIIVSVTGIFIVLLALVGLTYGYFLTRIQGNTNTKSITVTTADLKLVYGDGTGDIVAENIIPGDDIDTKTFTVYNDGNATVSNYNVYLENVVNTFNLKEDIVYTLTCESDDNTNSPCTNQIEDETTFPSTNTVLLTNTIAEGDTHTYTLTIKYKETNEDQTEDMGKLLSAKINLYDANGIPGLNLANYILSNGADITTTKTTGTFQAGVCGSDLETCLYNVEKYSCPVSCFAPGTEKTITETKNVKDIKTLTNITGVANGTSWSDDLGTYTNDGLFRTEDDYGDTYYYRGAVSNNYVSFAGFTWRIVRINGDGSVRLILSDTLNKTCVEYDNSNTCIKYAYNDEKSFSKNMNDNTYIGYMTGISRVTPIGGMIRDNVCVITTDGVKSVDINITEETSCTGEWMSSYDATHMNINDSNAKEILDTFYENYIKNANSENEKYLADVMFCGDKSISTNNISNNTSLGYGPNTTYYGAYDRILSSNEPTLKCDEGSEKNFSRYTVESYKTNNNVETNGNLKYPIAMITADELIFAGASSTETNNSYYLKDFSSGLTTMTPSSFLYDASSSYGTIYLWTMMTAQLMPLGALYIAPVINIDSAVLVNGGNGTADAPYTLKLAN